MINNRKPKFSIQDKRAEVNFDHPDSLDSDLIILHLSKIILGESFHAPLYDFKTHTRNGQLLVENSYTFIIIDGLFALYWSDIRNMTPLKIFIDLPADKCLKRRIKRDAQDRGRTKESIVNQFYKTVLPMYKQHVEPTKKHAELIINGDSPIKDSSEKIKKHLKESKIYTCD